MKKHLLTIALAVAGFTANAQWVEHFSNFPVDLAPSFMSVVDAQTVWTTGRDPLTPQASPTQIFTVTTDGGNTWKRGIINGTGSSVDNLDFSNICALSKDVAYAAMYDGTSTGGFIFKTTNGGTTWSKISKPNMFSAAASFPNVVYFYNANEGWAMGDPVNGFFEIFTTTDGGATWSARVPQTNFNVQPAAGEFGITDMYSVIGNKAWFATNKGKVYSSSDKGTTWTGVQVKDKINPAIASTRIDNVVFQDANNGLVNQGGNIFTTTDGGATWSIVKNMSGHFYGNDISAIPGLSGAYASVGADSTTQGSSFTTNNGQTWHAIDSTVLHTSVKFFNKNTGWSGTSVDAQDSAKGGMFTWNGTVGIIENAIRKGGVEIYPNPSADGVFNVATVGIENKDLTISVYDVMGRLVNQTHEYLTAASRFTRTVDLSANAKGIYIAEVKIGDKVTTQKLVIQ